MPYTLGPFHDIGLTEAMLARLLAEHDARLPAMRRLWAYYRNPAESRPAVAWAGASGAGVLSGGGGRRRLAQEAGLPARLAGARARGEDDRTPPREVVIENDIAWRMHAMVDFMFGRPATLVSNAADAGKRREIERLLDAVLEASGGIALLQDAGLLGAVYGHVDFLVRAEALFEAADEDGASAGSGVGAAALARAIDLASACRVEVVEPRRAIPVTSAADYRRLDAYVVRLTSAGGATPEDARATGLDDARRFSRFAPGLAPFLAAARSANRTHGAPGETLEVFSATHRQRYERGRLVEEAPNPLSVLPVVHVQNMSQPFAFEGLSEVEPLIPLQDELNTRLSDRANRVTMQSFKMFLAKGIDGFATAPVGPGQVWSTDNAEASVEAFGGDAASPSEDRHIEELREALDKASGVTPVVAGVLTKIGNLSSENALRVTLIGMLTRTARKRITYGRGLADVCGLILRAFDEAGVYRTTEAERAVRIVWPDPLPRDERGELERARLKRELGVPAERVLAELGYAPGDPGLT